jgi:pilus assembly protein TadC
MSARAWARRSDGIGTRPRAIIVSVLIGLAVAFLVGGWTGAALGVVAGPVLGVASARWLARQPSRSSVTEDRRVAGDLPFAADLLAAALRAGAAPDVAARCVGRALDGPLGQRLARVDRALGLGAPADEAWSYLGTVAGASRVVAAAVRSQHSGAAFAGALQRLADDLRADRLIAADAAARRAGVLIVLPLGLCFLPAFVLAGLVPVIVAVLGDVLSPQ